MRLRSSCSLVGAKEITVYDDKDVQSSNHRNLIQVPHCGTLCSGPAVRIKTTSVNDCLNRLYDNLVV